MIFEYCMAYVVVFGIVAQQCSVKKPGTGWWFFLYHFIVVSLACIGWLSTLVPSSPESSFFVNLCQAIPSWMSVGSFMCIYALVICDAAYSSLVTQPKDASDNQHEWAGQPWCYGHRTRWF